LSCRAMNSDTKRRYPCSAFCCQLRRVCTHS
jgi:hypothetical protein